MKKQNNLEDVYLKMNQPIVENVEAGTLEEPVINDIKGDGPGDQIEEPVERVDDDEKKSEKTEKTVKENINNLRTMKHNIFDKLYSTIMENDDDLPTEFPGDDLELGDEGDLEAGGEDEVTITLSKDLARELHDLLGKHLDDGEEEGEEPEELDGGLELAGNDPYGDEEVQAEAIKVEPEPKELGDSAHKDNKNNKVAASGYSGTGSAAANKGSLKTQAEPTELADSDLKDKKDNKVKTSASVGRQVGH